MNGESIDALVQLIAGVLALFWFIRAQSLQSENERKQKLLQQVLVDAQAQDVLMEWWHALECETAPNAKK